MRQGAPAWRVKAWPERRQAGQTRAETPVVMARMYANRHRFVKQLLGKTAIKADKSDDFIMW
jgi:hypothetical protein